MSLVRLAVVLILTGSLLAAAPPQERVEREEHDRCLACGTELGEGDFVLLHRGRRVPLHAGECDEVWRNDPVGQFGKLQPKSALFQEAQTESAPVRDPWFWVGLWVLGGLVCSAASAYLAVNRGQPPVAWFFAGLIGNVAALAVLVFIVPRGDATLLPAGIPAGLVKVPVTRAPRPCTGCGKPMHPAASSCPSCGAAVEPLVESEVLRAGR